MKITRIMTVAAVLAAGISAPALAGWDNIGSVHLDYGVDRSSAYSAFAGPIRSLELTAHDSDVNCTSVRATFGNGQTDKIFSGFLERGKPRTIDVPGDKRNIRSLAFLCRTEKRGGSNIDIDADLTGYRDQWLHDPHWAHLWAQLTPPPMQSGSGPYHGNDESRWLSLGGMTFRGSMDNQEHFSGAGAQNVMAIAIKPADGDARCTAIQIRFGNGRASSVGVYGGSVLKQGHFYPIDLPGDVRDISRINMSCGAISQRTVRIKLYVNK